MISLPLVESIPVYNRTGEDLHVVLEPEGDCITLKPGQVCKILPQPDEYGERISLEIECAERTISLHLNNIKEVYLDDVKVR